MNNYTIKDWEFSLFFNTDKGLFNCNPLQTISLKRLIEIYNSPYLKEKSKELIEASKPRQQIIKAQLPYFTYSGVYSYRNNESILSYNSSLLPLDIDGLSIEEAIKVQKTLSQQQGVVMSIISPRGMGVKALIYLGCDIEVSNHYQTLEGNIENIAIHLNIEEFTHKIDAGQFKLCQPFFIGFNTKHFFNENAIPTDWVIKNIPKKEVDLTPPKLTGAIGTKLIYKPGERKVIIPSRMRNLEQRRIYAYFNNVVSNLEDLFSSYSEGERHSNIWRVGGIASSLFYATHLKNEFKDRLFSAVVRMYGSEKEAKRVRAIKTFEDIWGNAQPKYNKIIEQIINECSINLNHLNND